MCGIVALIDQHTIAPTTLLAGLKTLQHRGPDGLGTWCSADKTLQLGHRRLAIVDPLGGAQPISNEDGSLVAIVNGEFYDDHQLRASLKKRGYRFSSHSDSEILVHLYEEHGLGSVDICLLFHRNNIRTAAKRIK